MHETKEHRSVVGAIILLTLARALLSMEKPWSLHKVAEHNGPRGGGECFLKQKEIGEPNFDSI